MDYLSDVAVIEAFVEYIADLRGLDLSVDSQPDVENRKTPDIDALAGPFAIEHTSIDTLENQRRDGSWFSEIVQPLEKEFNKNHLPFRLHLIFPYEGIKAGQDWDAIRDSLRNWVTDTAPTLPDGPDTIAILGIPFEVLIAKESDRPPGLFFVRFTPSDDDLSERIRILLARKSQKLKAYQEAGKTTILLVESSDIALMNVHKLAEAVQEAFPDALPDGVDELWHADTSVPAALEFWDLRPMILGSRD